MGAFRLDLTLVRLWVALVMRLGVVILSKCRLMCHFGSMRELVSDLTDLFRTLWGRNRFLVTGV